MSERDEIKKINTWLSFYYIQFDTSPPAVTEGRVHPVQFSNSVTRINAAGRSFREKKLFLGIMLWLAVAIIVVYPILDTDWYLPVFLIFGSLALVDYMYYCTLQAKTAALLLDTITQENDLFINNGMCLHFFPYENRLQMEVVRPLTNQDNLQEYASSSPFHRLHEIYGSQNYEESAPTSRRSSVSSLLVDIEPAVFLPTTSELLQPIEEEPEILQPATSLTAYIPPVSTPPQLLSDAPIVVQPEPEPEHLQYTSFATATPYIDPDMPEGVSISPPPPPSLPLSAPVKTVHTAPVPRRSVLSSSAGALKSLKKRGRRVSISDDVSVFRPITEEGEAAM